MSSNQKYFCSRLSLLTDQSYLREVLEEIALLNKRGTYALKWSLKPHYSQQREGHNTLLNPSGGQKAKFEPKEEEDVKMEDIL
jgi:transcription initiation factor TFIIF subunit beta